jgi:ribosomal protein S18 acetylase RimI-like enzyme
MQIATVKGIFHIREAEVSDLPALVHIHVTSWNATYPYYHPKPSHSLREQQWTKAFELKEQHWFCYVVTKDNGEPVGFSTGNDYNHKELPYQGQLNKIHFLKDYHRLGLGRKLVAVVAKRFLEQEINSMILFADPGNENIAFYDRLGGKRILDKDGKFQGAYGWHDLNKLVEVCMADKM